MQSAGSTQAIPTEGGASEKMTYAALRGSHQARRREEGGRRGAGRCAKARLARCASRCVTPSEKRLDLVDIFAHCKMDDCQYASIGIAQHKAKAAATFRRPTVVFERLLGKGPFFSYLTTLDGMIGSRGGNPMVANGKIIGAIGVSGGSGSQDDTISQAGVAALK